MLNLVCPIFLPYFTLHFLHIFLNCERVHPVFSVEGSAQRIEDVGESRERQEFNDLHTDCFLSQGMSTRRFNIATNFKFTLHLKQLIYTTQIRPEAIIEFMTEVFTLIPTHTPPTYPY